MREIKFRAWAHASQVIFYPESDDGWELENGVLTAIPNTTLMQYTGLKDKNGVEIYEGDIVEFDAAEWGDNTTNKHLVSWDSENATFCFGGGLNYENEYRTVIGNIHENPELLENHDYNK